MGAIMRSIPKTIPSSSSAFGNIHRAHSFGGGGVTVSPLQAYFIGVSCAVVFMVCIFFVADASSSSNAATPGRRRGRGGRRDSKSPRRRKNRNIDHPPTGGNASNILDDHFLRPSARMVANSISNDRARRGLTSSWNTNPIAANSQHPDAIQSDVLLPQSQSSIVEPGVRPFESSMVICRVIGHHPIARNRSRYNQNRAALHHENSNQFSTPDTYDEPAYSEGKVWSFSALDEPSYELLKRMNYQPLHRDSNKGPNDTSHEKTKALACPLDPVECIKETNYNNHVAASSSEHADDDKENVHKQLGDDADDVRLKMKSSINMGKKSSRITIGKVGSAPINVSSPSNYSSVIEIQRRGGNDDPDNHNDGTDMHDSGYFTTGLKDSSKSHHFEGTCEHDSSNSNTNDIDWALSSTESTGKNCHSKTMRLRESMEEGLLVKTRPTSQGAELNPDKSNLVAPPGRLTVLISNGVNNYYQASNQKAALSLLGDLRIPHDVVDGMDSSQKERRDAFFEISGVRGNYPQIFLTSETGDEHSFLGGYDWLHDIDLKDLEAIVVIERNSSGKDEPRRGPVDASATPSLAKITRPSLTILISKGVYDNDQAARQKSSLDLLDDLCIPYDIVDGMDQLQLEKRDVLFTISGIRGNYPQIFFRAKDGDGGYIYLGGYDWLRKLHESEIADLKLFGGNQEK